MPKQDVTNEDFIQQMTVGTLPTDQGTSGSFIGRKFDELGISPADFLLMAGKFPSALGLALTPTPAGAGEEEELARLRGLAAQETAATESGTAKALLQAVKSKNPAAAVKAISEVTKAKPKSLTKKDLQGIASELETSRGQLAELVKKYPQLRDASVADVEALTKGDPFTAYRGISLLPGRELRREEIPSMTMDPSVAMSMLKDAPVMMTKEGFITATPVLRQYPGMQASETQVYVPSLIEQISERQPGALEMKIPTRSGEKMTVADIFKEVKGEKELLADVSKKEPQDVLFNRYQGGVGDRYLMEVARKVLAGKYEGGESLVKEIGGYQTDPKALAKEFDEFAEMVKVGKTVSSPKAAQQIFEQAEKLPTNQFIDEVMSAHIGGVGDFGDESAKYYLSQIPGGPAYIKASQELAKKNLGNQFMAYRLMSKDQFEALQSGDLGDLLSFSLSQSSAEALKKFVKNQKRDDLVVAEVPLTPEHVVAFGSRSEQEVIIDTGVGWSLDQFKQAAPLKKANGGDVSNEDFIQQMMTGTPPSDQEADPDVLKDIVRGAQYTPFDLLGAPVDIATMAIRPFGYNVEKPVGGSEYFIDQAAKLGLFKPSTGSAAELLGRISGGGATPAIARGITKAADATGDFISGQLKGRADSRAVQQAASKVPPDTAYDPLRDRMEQIGALTYAVKPTPAPIVQAPKNQMGFYSAVEDTILNLPQEKGTAQQFLAQISKAPGVKQGEIKATGLEDFLKSKGTGPVTKEEVRSFLDGNKVQVDEVVLGAGKVLSPEAKRLSDAAFSRMEEADSRMVPYFDRIADMVGGQDPYAPFYQIRGPLSRKIAKGDEEALSQLNALNLPPDVKQAVFDFAIAKQEYQTYAKQSRRMEKPRFDKYNISGGTNPREIYLTLPEEQTPSFLPPSVNAQGVLVKPMYAPQPKFTAPSSHSVSPEADKNRVAHIFLDDRTDAQGNKVLFVQEMQSDWAQAGRDKGFFVSGQKAELPEGTKVFEPGAPDSPGQTNQAFTVQIPRSVRRRNLFYGTTREEALANAQSFIAKPNSSAILSAPFVTTTEDWINLALKRVINEAVENGYNKVAFISGQQAAKKYSLSTVLDGIEVTPMSTPLSDSRYIDLKQKGGGIIELLVDEKGEIDRVSSETYRQFIGKPLPEIVGKEMAEKIMTAKPKPGEGDSVSFSVKDMEVGGEGMKGFYDNILPKTANKLLEKLGSKIEPVVMEKEVPSRLQNYASSFMDWMTVNHPGVSSSDAARAWAMGMDNNSFVKEYYEATRPMEQLGFKITPEMIEMVKTKGLPQFAKGGEVSTKDFIRSHA